MVKSVKQKGLGSSVPVVDGIKRNKAVTAVILEDQKSAKSAKRKKTGISKKNVSDQPKVVARSKSTGKRAAVLTEQDPFRQREAEKYENPIPSREFIMQRLGQLGKPAHVKTIIKLMGVTDLKQKEAMGYRLKAMQRDGQLITDRRGRLALVNQTNLIKGVVEANINGYGFLVGTDSPDGLFVNPRQMRRVLPGDQVLAGRSIDYSGREEAIIVEVLQHNIKNIVGHYQVEHGVALIKPLNPELSTRTVLVASSKEQSVEIGDIVLADILEYPDHHLELVVEIREVWGKEFDSNTIVNLTLNLQNIPHEWSRQIQQECEILTGMSVTVGSRRVDLRALPLVTIDGDDSRDFDDAVAAIPDGDGWKLFVAIADVATYVTERSILNQEAMERGNSVYFPQQVVPMLPSVLSDGLCSLMPEQDRYALVVELQLTASGRVLRYQICEAVIRSKARLTYDQVYQYLENTEQSEVSWGEDVKRLRQVYYLLLKQHKRRGAIAFKRLEAQLQFDASGNLTNITAQTPNYVHSIIEECMLAANVAAADFLLKHHAPAMFRVHDAPSMEKLSQVQQFLSLLKVNFSWKQKVTAKDYARVLARIHDRRDEHLINLILLRSMKQAVYRFDNLGHFALSYAHYVHFTSPIRRYPDLFNHRLIKLLLQHPRYFTGKYAKDRIAQYRLDSLARHCSTTERRADEAERSVVNWHKAKFISNYVGQSFEGVISGVTHFGLFVEIDRFLIEGLVHVSSLPVDYYRLEGTYQRLVGRKHGVQFCLGERVTVIVARVDVDEQEISFELVEPKRNKMRKR